MNKKTIALAGVTTLAVGIVGLAGVAGLSVVSAQNNLEDYPPIIQNLAEKFGATPEEVQDVFKQTREERRARHLEQLVEDGKITEDQKELIMKKQDELQAKRDEIRNSQMTFDERRNAMQELHEEMQQWAEENGIDLPMSGRGRDMGNRGMRMGMGKEEGYGPMNEL